MGISSPHRPCIISRTPVTCAFVVVPGDDKVLNKYGLILRVLYEYDTQLSCTSICFIIPYLLSYVPFQPVIAPQPLNAVDLPTGSIHLSTENRYVYRFPVDSLAIVNQEGMLYK